MAAEAQIARHARQFEGAWAYLELIAEAARLGDPLDPRVVEAYWIGNDLLDLIDDLDTADRLRERLPPQSGASWGPGSAHHGYHVFEVYPWCGLLQRAGADSGAAATALRVLDQCRIRWGTVISIGASRINVLCRPLERREGMVLLGDATEQSATLEHDGTTLLTRADGAPAGPAVGDEIAMHWDWVCDVLTREQVTALQTYTEEQLARVNAAI